MLARRDHRGCVALFVGLATAAEKEFLNRFDGSFTGGGTVMRSGDTNQVTCTLTGQPSDSGISMSGECGIAGFSKQISANLRFDQKSGRYSGTYVGAAVGPAALSGRRRGDAVVLTITWPSR